MAELERFIEALMPEPRLAFGLAPAAALYAWAAAVIAGRLRTHRDVRAPYTRKIFHFTIFTAASVVHLAWGLGGVVVFGGVVTIGVLIAVRRGDDSPLYQALARPTDAPHRTLFILVPLATTVLGGLASNLLFAGTAFIGYLVAGWGDAVGEPVGARWGRHRYRVPSLAGVPATRSIEGSAAVLVCGAAAAGIGMALAGADAIVAVRVAVGCGLAGTLVEAASTHGLDNFTVQVAAAGVAAWIV